MAQPAWQVREVARVLVLTVDVTLPTQQGSEDWALIQALSYLQLFVVFMNLDYPSSMALPST